MVGETWLKSACTMCPFSGGKPEVLQRYHESPAEAAEALFIEFLALAMNERMTLFSKKSLRAVLEKNGHAEALRIFHERLAEIPWAVYRVRRLLWAKGRGDRCTERLSEGKRDQVVADLLKQGAQVEGDHVRLWVRQRGEEYPGLEEMLVACPAVVDEKSRPRFSENWDRLSGKGLF
jgi:hypothetical protein